MDHQPTPAATDADLAHAWSAGDERGYDAIFGRYAPMVFSRCRRALGAVDADDATQAVFLVLARKREQAIASPALAAWLMVVADNVVRNAKRDRARRRRAESTLPPPPPAAEEPAMDDIKDHLDACLAALPAAEREAVSLHHLAGHSLAEVAGHVGAGLSTVKDRLNRGLSRLRTTLAKRGVVLGAVGLLACLQAEAQAAVPEEVMVHLRDLVTADGGTGTTAAPSARARHWSRNGPSTMTRLAIAGSSLLLLGSVATCALTSADNQTPAPVTAPSPAAAPAQVLDLDPEHARNWMVLRWNDGPRLAKRLRTLPEVALLPPEGTAWLDEVASLHEAVVLVDCQGALSREQRAEAFRLQQKLANMTLHERLELVNVEMHKVALTKGQSTVFGPNPWSIAGVSGWMNFSDPDAPALGRLRALLAAGSLPGGVSVKPDAGGWTLDSATGGARLVLAGSRLDISGRADESVPAMLAAARMPVVAGADLEMSSLVDSGRPGSALRDAGTMHLTIGNDGMRFSYRIDDASVPAGSATGEASPPVDLKRLDAVPASAFLAASMAMTPGNAVTSAFWESMLQSVVLPLELSGDDGKKDSVLATLRGILTALRQVDGEVVAWVEPGAPVPVFTIEADLPRPAADTLIASFGQAPAADGSASILVGVAMVSLGWNDGRLVCTTNPGGLAAIDRRGGFTRQPDIRRALAAMPDQQPSVCILMRPAALMAFVGPYVAMVSPAWQQRVEDYEHRLDGDTAYGFFTAKVGSTSTRVEAAGLLSLIAGAAMASKLAEPGAMRIAN
jgi:RNA polymerase sigma factor (sigma-70 family)